MSVTLFMSDTSDEEDSSANITKRGEDFNVLLQKSGITLDRHSVVKFTIFSI